MTDGIQSIQARIAEIQRQFAPPAQPVRTASPASSSNDFAAVLNQVTAGNASKDLSSYANGRIPENLLTPIGNGEKLAPAAAQGFLRMQRDAASVGVRFEVNDSYRSHDEQVEMARTKGIYGRGGLAAVPGTSNHGKGISVDLELNPAAQKWMQANAGRYGFVNDVRGEPWHWTYK